MKKMEEETELSKDQTFNFRGITARIHFLAAHRPDLQHAAKEVCREMSSPTSGSPRFLLRIRRYLLGRPRMI